jgi:Piwi domain
VKKARVAKASCAAIIVQVVRPGAEKRHNVEIYSETFARSAGEEYGLQDALSKAISNALTILNVSPMCCIVWRDGIGDSAFDTLAGEEITGIRQGLLGGKSVVGSSGQQQTNGVPLSYIVAQKRIATKFVTQDGKYGAPPGTLVEGIQGLKYDTFYIQGRAPPFSTPKPVRFVVVEQDQKLQQVQLPELTWAMCHDYPNWPGPIKVPSVCMHAHKLAELGGGFANCGASIDHKAFANTVHFL